MTNLTRADDCPDFHCDFWDEAETCKGCEHLKFEDGDPSSGGEGQRPYCEKGRMLWIYGIYPTKEKKPRVSKADNTFLLDMLYNLHKGGQEGIYLQSDQLYIWKLMQGVISPFKMKEC